MEGSFSASSKPIFATKYKFCSIFRDLQDSKTFAPLRPRIFGKISPRNSADIFNSKVLINYRMKNLIELENCRTNLKSIQPLVYISNSSRIFGKKSKIYKLTKLPSMKPWSSHAYIWTLYTGWFCRIRDLFSHVFLDIKTNTIKSFCLLIFFLRC